MNSTMEPASEAEHAGFEAGLIDLLGVLAHLEALAESDPRREAALARIAVTADEVEALLDDAHPGSAACADACDVLAVARALCRQKAPVEEARRRAGSLAA